MRAKQRRIVFWSLLVCCPLVFVWAANYYSHPVRILFVIGALIVAAFIVRAGFDRGK